MERYSFCAYGWLLRLLGGRITQLGIQGRQRFQHVIGALHQPHRLATPFHPDHLTRFQFADISPDRRTGCTCLGTGLHGRHKGNQCESPLRPHQRPRSRPSKSGVCLYWCYRHSYGNLQIMVMKSVCYALYPDDEQCLASRLTISEYSDLFHAHHKNRIGWSNNPARSRGEREKARLDYPVFCILTSDRVINVDELVTDSELLGEMLPQCLDTISLGCVMPRRKIMYTALARDVHGLLGDLTTDEGIQSLFNGSIDIGLRRPRTPADGSNRRLSVQVHAAAHVPGGHGSGPASASPVNGCGNSPYCPSDIPASCSESIPGIQTRASGCQLGVIAQFRVRIQR